MFEGGEKRTIDAALEGKLGCPYHNDFEKYPNMTERDQEGILLPSTIVKSSQSQNVRTRAFRSAEERNEHIRLMVCKCEGLYIFYKLWIAARILDITKDELKLLVKDRVRPVGDIYRCFSLAFNCKFFSFVREGLNLGRYGYSVNVGAIIAATDPNKCDTPLLDMVPPNGALDTRRSSQEVCPGARSPKEFGRRVPSTYQTVHWGQVCVMQMWIILLLMWCGAPTNSNTYIHSDVDCGTMWASPHLLLASHQCHCDGTTLHHGMISCVQDEWMCIHLHIPTTMTFRISWMELLLHG